MNSHRGTTDFDTLKKTLSKVNKCLYKADLSFNSISFLEKSAITGRSFNTKEATPIKKTKKQASPADEILKHHHKNTKNIKIIQLPKLPFGYHKTYNDDSNFIQDHFDFNRSEDEELSKKLEDFQRKFRLFEKQQGKSKRKFGKTRNHFQNSNYYVFKMNNGNLYCPLASEAVGIYEKDKALYKDEIAKQTFRDIYKLEMNDDIKINLNKRKIQSDTIQRLCPTRENTETPVSLFYTTKYSPLFEKGESPERPKTSLKLNYKLI